MRPPTARDQVYESLRESLRVAGLGRGPWEGDPEGRTVAAIADAVEHDLCSRLAALDVVETQRFAAGVLAAHADAQYRARVARSPSPARAQFHAESFTAWGVILEIAARRSVGVRRRHEPSARDLEALGLLGSQLCHLRTVADRVRSGLTIFEGARLTRDGLIRFDVSDRLPFRISRFEKAYFHRMANRDPARGSVDVTLAAALVNVLREGADIPEEFDDIDAAMRRDRGHGIVDLLAAFQVMIRVSEFGEKDTVGYRFKDASALDQAVRDNVRALVPHADPDSAVAAGRKLVWSQDLLQRNDIDLFQYRSAEARLYSRPVLQFADETLMAPRGAQRMALLVWVSRLIEGTWPERLPPDDVNLKRSLDARRERIRPIVGFERELAAILDATGLPYAVNIGTSQPDRPAAAIGVSVSTEIDAIVVVPHTRTIWVIEAKDSAAPFSARQIRGNLQKYFWAKKPYVRQLQLKVLDVAADPEIVASRLGVGEHSGPFAVRGMFVTREPIPAAFHDDRVHEFVTIDRLPAWLAKIT
ncbi:hypothetical protein ACQP2E_21135 [Actinoplanes sp. CA-015351]|uniref:hypothetical protein n=1 Tax=Actinoplanes sp. CA-015351 TaxID=3239897 RepID=UPI003D95EF40